VDDGTLQALHDGLRNALDSSARVVHMDETLSLIRRLMDADGREFSLADGASTDAAGGGVVQFNGPSTGQIWRVEAIGISVGGASNAAIVAAYIGQNDERNLLPGFYLPALSGGAPSRGMMGPPLPGYVPAGTPLLVVVRGAVANQQGGIAARVQGRVIEQAEAQGHLGEMPAPVTAGQM
jgi:hypothetical protein